MELAFLIGNIVLEIFMLSFYMVIVWLWFYNPFKFNKEKMIVKIERTFMINRFITFYTARTLKVLRLKYNFLWFMYFAFIIVPMFLPLIYYWVDPDRNVLALIYMLIPHIIVSIVINVFTAKYKMEFQKIDIKTREYLLSNNENFPMILEEELKRVRAYKIDENVNAEKILNDRRTKFNMKYFLKRINKAESKIDKFALLQEAIGNNLVFIHAYKDPYNYTKYFEQQMYIKAGFLTEN